MARSALRVALKVLAPAYTIDFTDLRTIMPTTPVAAYGGVKSKFRGGR